MSKIAVVYWSGTGNTEAMANLVAEGARGAGAQVDLIQAGDFGADQVAAYDALALGCPAMGDEDLEDTEFEPMYDEVEPLLGDRKVLLFGSYEWNEGEWMEKWEQRAVDAGVNVVEALPAYSYPDDDAAAECKRAGGQLA